MTQEEFLSFLRGLYDYRTKEDKQKYAEQFYEKMFNKYNNQFDSNGYIEELIEVLKNLQK